VGALTPMPKRMRSRYDMTTTVHFILTCDGGSRGNGSPNSEGYGSFMVQIPDNESSLSNTRQYGTGVTNNEAEYMSLIDALEHVSRSFDSVAADVKTIKLTIRMDSATVIGHMSMGWRIKAPNLMPLAVKARDLINSFGKVTFEKIKENKMKEIIGH
jgi:ribonuclease HI